MARSVAGDSGLAEPFLYDARMDGDDDDDDDQSHISKQVSGLECVDWEPSEEKQRRRDRANVWNVFKLGLGFCITFSGFLPIQGYQTSLNDSLGNYSLATVYGVMAICNFLSPLIVQKIGARTSLFIGGLGFVIFCGASIKAEASWLLPASVLLGISSAIIWTAQGDYLFRSSTSKNIGTMSGLYFAIYRFSGIIGSVITGLLLHGGTADVIVFSILTGIAFLGAITFLLLGHISSYVGKSVHERKSQNTVVLTIRMLFSSKVMLLSPSVLYSGLSFAFYLGIFTLVVERTGKNNVAWYLAVWGAFEVVGSLLSGKFIDRWSRSTIMFYGFGFWACGLSTALGAALEDDDSTRLGLSFVSAFFFGIGDSCLNTGLYSIFRNVFLRRNEGAFAAFKLLQAVGRSAGFFFGLILSPRWYILLLAGFLLSSFVCIVSLKSCIINFDGNPDDGKNPGSAATVVATMPSSQNLKDMDQFTFRRPTSSFSMAKSSLSSTTSGGKLQTMDPKMGMGTEARAGAGETQQGPVSRPAPAFSASNAATTTSNRPAFLGNPVSRTMSGEISSILGPDSRPQSGSSPSRHTAL